MFVLDISMHLPDYTKPLSELKADISALAQDDRRSVMSVQT
jgi:hypothetical protein